MQISKTIFYLHQQIALIEDARQSSEIKRKEYDHKEFKYAIGFISMLGLSTSLYFLSTRETIDFNEVFASIALGIACGFGYFLAAVLIMVGIYHIFDLEKKIIAKISQQTNEQSLTHSLTEFISEPHHQKELIIYLNSHNAPLSKQLQLLFMKNDYAGATEMIINSLPDITTEAIEQEELITYQQKLGLSDNKNNSTHLDSSINEHYKEKVANAL